MTRVGGREAEAKEDFMPHPGSYSCEHIGNPYCWISSLPICPHCTEVAPIADCQLRATDFFLCLSREWESTFRQKSFVLLPSLKNLWLGELRESSVSGQLNLTKLLTATSPTTHRLGGQHLSEPYSPHLNTQIPNYQPQIFVGIQWDDICQVPGVYRYPVNTYFSFFLPFLSAAPSQSESQKSYSANAKPNTVRYTSFLTFPILSSSWHTPVSWHQLPCSLNTPDTLPPQEPLLPAWLVSSPLSSFCSDAIFSARPTLITVFKTPALPFPSLLSPCYII